MIVCFKGVLTIKKELEIEYKNRLTKQEYQKMKKIEFLNLPNNDYRKITQINHYFDTKDQTLKKQQAALRIRITDTHKELTFKVPSQNFLMETNLSLNSNQVKEILNKECFTLSDFTNKAVNLELQGIDNQTTFNHFNSFETFRLEKVSNENLFVLDQTVFQNGAIDYELEVESNDTELGKSYFDSILKKHSIPQRKSLPKIARAESNK